MPKITREDLPFDIGMPPEVLDYDNILKPFSETLEQLKTTSDDDSLIRYLLSSLSWNSNLAALCMHLLGEREQAKEWANKALSFIEEYFFGEWRDKVPSGNYRDRPPDRVYQDKRTSWEAEFTSALLWCSALGQWDRLERIACYLRDDVKLDIEQTKERRAWLIVLAGIVRGRSRVELQPFVDTILSGRRISERLLLWLLDAILEDAADEASEFLADYTKRYRRIELPKGQITKKISSDATFLVHWARYCDVDLHVPEELKPHLVIFE